jgi:hypothetical protein
MTSKSQARRNKLMEKHGDVAVYFSDSDDDFENKSGILASPVNLYDSICLGYAEGQQGVQTYMPSPNPHPNPVEYLGAVLDANDSHARHYANS